MKKMILKWKTIFPIQEYEINDSMTDKMLGNMIMHYSHNIKKLTITHYYRSLLTINGYHYVALLHSNLLELSIHKCLEGGLCVISDSLVNLTSLSIPYSPSVSSGDLDSLSKLTNLEKINLYNIQHLDDAAVVNYSTLTKMKSIKVDCCHGLSGFGLSYLVENKQFLVQLKIIWCSGISSERYHCLTTLTNLTSLTVVNSKLDDIGLNIICSSCLLIAYLDIRNDKSKNLITIEGLNNIHYLIHLKTLSLSGASDKWFAKLSYSTALTQLDLLTNSTVSDEGLLQLSSLVKLTFVNVNEQKRVLRKI
jgi:hypothetical protein